MILVDTSVWIDHLRAGNPRLKSLLGDGEVLCHAFVIGELACGTLCQRTNIIRLVSALPKAPMMAHADVLDFLETFRLHGKGIGWIDTHLLASAASMACPSWTSDRRLRAPAADLGVSA